MQIPESELILNADGSVYHLHLLPHQIAQNIIVVGDPDRVPKVSQFFDTIEHRVQKREFVTHTGTYKGKPLSVISSGIGTDNVEILMTELDALANIDLQKRTIKEKLTALNIIRIGTSGSLQNSVPLGSHLVSMYGIGLDTLMCFYELSQNQFEYEVGKQLKEALAIPFQPYCVPCSDTLAAKFGTEIVRGATATCCGFYAPQGRKVRNTLKTPNLVEVLSSFKLPESPDFQFTNFEMETAGYYAMGRLLGHNMLSVNAIVANRITHKFHHSPEKCVNELIEKVLTTI